MSEVERMQQLVELALSWLECDKYGRGAFIPNNEEADKIAVTRTQACGRQLLKVLAGGAE